MPNFTDLAEPPTPGGAALVRLRQVVAGLGCTPVECVALSVLIAGALAALGILWMAARPGPPPQRPPAGGGAQVEAEEVVVHVAGAVTVPGLYRLPGGSRVDDALATAGGPLPGAVLDGLNLARPLTDGEQVLAPAAGVPTPAAAPGANLPPSATRSDGKVDLNRATVQDLDALPGIGPVLAQRIIGYRGEHGPFKTVGKLRDVPGIGERTFQQLAPLVAVG
ncbi:MAG: helix-hairpin-helix domain-containing protein [Egibacteraceae bacterium]